MASKSTHLINGKDVISSGWFEVKSPENDTVVSLAARASEDIVDAAISSAQDAFVKWRSTSYLQRRELFNRAADILAARKEEIVSCMIYETAAKEDWALGGNVLGAAGLLREVASLASHVKGEVIPSATDGTTTLVTREPAGVVLAISPWNSPVILSCRAVAVAILCGNTAILKSSEYSPRTQRFVAEVFRDAGFPDGVLNYLNMAPDESPALIERIIAHKSIRRVNFTGSERVGKIIARHCATYGPKQCVLELGGKAPAIILEDANLDATADAIVFSSMMHSGQICFSMENVIAVGSIADSLVGKLEARIKKLWSGKSEASSARGRPEMFRLGPLFRESAAIAALDLLKTAVDDGAKVIVGDLRRDGCFISPHLVDYVSKTTKLFREESFAPICCVVRVSSLDEAVELANSSDFSLTAAVYGTDISKVLDVTQALRSGAVHVNGPTLSFESNRPYGGCGGASGYGRFGGTAGIAEYTDIKVVTLNKPGGPPVSLV